jgi:hypothetical protein
MLFSKDETIAKPNLDWTVKELIDGVSGHWIGEPYADGPHKGRPRSDEGRWSDDRKIYTPTVYRYVFVTAYRLAGVAIHSEWTTWSSADIAYFQKKFLQCGKIEQANLIRTLHAFDREGWISVFDEAAQDEKRAKIAKLQREPNLVEKTMNELRQQKA